MRIILYGIDVDNHRYLDQACCAGTQAKKGAGYAHPTGTDMEQSNIGWLRTQALPYCSAERKECRRDDRRQLSER